MNYRNTRFYFCEHRRCCLVVIDACKFICEGIYYHKAESIASQKQNRKMAKLFRQYHAKILKFLNNIAVHSCGLRFFCYLCAINARLLRHAQRHWNNKTNNNNKTFLTMQSKGIIKWPNFINN